VFAHVVFVQTKLPRPRSVRTIIKANRAAPAIGPYSQAILTGGLIFVSGQIPLDPETEKLITGNIVTQTHRVIQSIEAILEEAGAALKDVVHTTIFLIDLKDFSVMNGVYETYFKPPEPARSTVQVAGLPKGACIEINAIASLI